MIVSSDKDFIQLHRYSNVKQYSPMKRSLIKEADPKFYKFDHICRGDTSDGVPNILSPDDTFENGLRQTPMYKKKIQTWYEAYPNICDDGLMTQQQYRNYCRNKLMIDLDCIPIDLRENIMNKYNSQKGKKNNKILNYLITQRMNMLVESASDFFTKEN